jgi:hypothetical protein
LLIGAWSTSQAIPVIATTAMAATHAARPGNPEPSSHHAAMTLASIGTPAHAQPTR